jgi:hypothetical protein
MFITEIIRKLEDINSKFASSCNVIDHQPNHEVFLVLYSINRNLSSSITGSQICEDSQKRRLPVSEKLTKFRNQMWNNNPNHFDPFQINNSFVKA